jgi:hypothetical protein
LDAGCSSLIGKSELLVNYTELSWPIGHVSGRSFLLEVWGLGEFNDRARIHSFFVSEILTGTDAAIVSRRHPITRIRRKLSYEG